MKKILLTRGVSNNMWLIQSLMKKGFSVILSHDLDEWKAKSLTQETLYEPRELSDEDYLSWLNNIISFHNDIEYIIPGNHLSAFSLSYIYPEISRRLILGSDTDKISYLDNKSLFYKKCLDNNLSCAIDFENYRDYNSFLSAKNKLIKLGYLDLCIKPSVGIFASGFHYFTNQDPLKRMTIGSDFAITYDEYENALKKSDFQLPEMIIMPRYNGKEISVDGTYNESLKTYSMCARMKIPGVGQKILIDKNIYNLSSEIVNIFKLKGIFNIQFMLHNNEYKILEVNPRASGGIYYSEEGDVDLIGNLFGEKTNLFPQKEKIIY